MYVSCAGTLTLPEERRLPQRFNVSDLSSCRSNRRKDWFLGGWCSKVTLGVDVASPFQSLPEPMDIPGIGGTEYTGDFSFSPPLCISLKEVSEISSFGYWSTVDAWNKLCNAEVFLQKSLAVVAANLGAGMVRKSPKILKDLGASHIMNYTEYTRLWLSPEYCLSTPVSFPSCSSSRNVQALFLTDCWWIWRGMSQLCKSQNRP